MSGHAFFGSLLQLGLIVGLFFAGPFLLFYLATMYSNHLATRGKYHQAYRFNRAVYDFTDIPLLRLWLGKFHYFQLRELGERAQKIGNKAAALDWLRLAAETRFTPSERVHALTALATLLRKQDRKLEAEAAEAEALAIVPDAKGPVGHRRSFAEETAATRVAQAGVLIGQGRFDEALVLLGQASGLTDGPRFEYSGERVNALRLCGKYDEALTVQETYEQDRQTRMGRLLATPTKHEKTNTVLRTMEDHARTHYLTTRVALYLEMGNTDAAGEHWRTLPEIMEDLTRAVRHAAGAWLSAAQGDADAANTQIAKAESAPAREDYTKQIVGYFLARAEMALKDYPPAAERLEKLVETLAHIPLAQAEYRALLGVCYTEMGRIADARIQYEQVIAAGFEEAVFTRKARTELAEFPAGS